MRSTILAISLVCAAICGVESIGAQAQPCTPAGGLSFICGVQNPEDLVVVPNTRWMIASGMAPGSGLHLVDTQAKTVRNLYASGTARADKTKYASCPGPLDAKQAVLHGLSLRAAQGGRYTIYATNHGGRESVEVWELDASGATPSMASRKLSSSSSPVMVTVAVRPDTARSASPASAGCPRRDK